MWNSKNATLFLLIGFERLIYPYGQTDIYIDIKNNNVEMKTKILYYNVDNTYKSLLFDLRNPIY